ncbi:TPA: hypothetical protein N0F65_007485 [Lagenidium giganteum]|uniref:Zinc transporter n=1 Tax=Lagenidium giganteum TaxID=4803 RepID=A0AAV2ZCX9_9STRA|nr:TPA: hypothetical protein N0F65_007485 [Lagenidium giganteum]
MARSNALCLLGSLILLTSVLGVVQAHGHGHDHGHEHGHDHGHDHGHEHEEDEHKEHGKEHAWEHVMQWTLDAANYSVEVCASHEHGEEIKHMLFEVLALPASDNATVNATMEKAGEIVETFASDKVVHEDLERSTGVIKVKAANDTKSPDVLYRVVFGSNSSSPCVTAQLQIAANGQFLVFAQHGKDEVTVRVMDAKNKELELQACVEGCEDEEEEAKTKSSNKQNWSSPILASLVISLTSLVGVFILSFDKSRVEVIIEYMTSFAAGCLLGVVVFHLYPEGTEYLTDIGEWVMGACVLGGIAFSMAIEQGVHMILAAFGVDNCSGHGHGHDHDHSTSDEHSHSEDKTPREHRHSHGSHTHHQHVEINMQDYQAHPSTPSVVVLGEPKDQLSFRAKYFTSLKRVDPVAWITAVGDFFHAFVDGVVLAVAFKSCSSATGWAVALGIVLHEVPHRVGDFFVFLRAGMAVPQALAINFIASLASLLGAVVLLAAGAVSNHTLGYLLSAGAGALLFIAMAELMPPMLSVRDRKRAIFHFLWFAFGCVLIGLSVLQHVHCEAE